MASVNKSDWGLNRKGLIDQERHNKKVKDAIKENLADIVSREDIILFDGKKTIKVPIRNLEEYKLRYDNGKQDAVGQGQGGSQKGQVIGKQGDENGQGPQAGDQAGTDYYEADVSLDELMSMVFEDLGLPNLEDKRQQEIESEAVRFTDIRKHGILSNLDKRRTIRENIKRNAAQNGEAKFKDVRTEDLRFKTWEETHERQANAVVIAMMDVSGSMGEFEKYISRTFYYWMVRFLRTKYNNVEIIFIAHHTEAKEVSESEFFTKGESGGTKVSSAYQLAVNIIAERYNPTDWNIYPFHFSDGDNMFADNRLCVDLVQELIAKCNLFGYGQIKQGWNPSGTLMSVYTTEITNPKFIGVTIEEKTDVYPALQKFFSKELERQA